jgi:hypothetical protein
MNIPTTLQNLPAPNRPEYKSWLSLRQVYERISRVVNGNVELGNPTSGPANIRGNWTSVTTPGTANTDFTVTHNLGRPAVGYLVATKNAACDVYTSPTANPNPNTQIILRATVINVNLTIFLF